MIESTPVFIALFDLGQEYITREEEEWLIPLYEPKSHIGADKRRWPLKLAFIVYHGQNEHSGYDLDNEWVPKGDSCYLILATICNYILDGKYLIKDTGQSPEEAMTRLERTPDYTIVTQYFTWCINARSEWQNLKELVDFYHNPPLPFACFDCGITGPELKLEFSDKIRLPWFFALDHPGVYRCSICYHRMKFPDIS